MKTRSNVKLATLRRPKATQPYQNQTLNYRF